MYEHFTGLNALQGAELLHLCQFSHSFEIREQFSNMSDQKTAKVSEQRGRWICSFCTGKLQTCHRKSVLCHLCSHRCAPERAVAFRFICPRFKTGQIRKICRVIFTWLPGFTLVTYQTIQRLRDLSTLFFLLRSSDPIVFSRSVNRNRRGKI